MANCSAFGSNYFCVSFSHERKSERIERKPKNTKSNSENSNKGGSKTSQAMQQLQIQQQQLISQLQLVQQRLLMVSKPHQKSNIDCETAPVHTVQWCIRTRLKD